MHLILADTPGSPPPMRGKEVHLVVDDRRRGITPAHAGKRRFSSGCTRGIEDHPRPCGEKLLEPIYVGLGSGSPPPMRGKDSYSATLAAGTRITPAHAGKSSASMSSASAQGDHPRPCGEKFIVTSHYQPRSGSPPPMRGKVILLFQSPLSCRITPAHAGKSLSKRRSCIKRKDHPRPCGEKQADYEKLDADEGSPPPMRGKGRRGVCELSNAWITPAHAGKSPESRPPCVCLWDHPRPCGEKIAILLLSNPNSGSPPPMRGKVLMPLNGSSGMGITPAHAGKSPITRQNLWVCKDHPRPCGEKRKHRERQPREQGSPPPMRGKGRDRPGR